MTDGTFLFLVRFFLCVDKEKNEQASSLAKQITKIIKENQ